MIRLINAELRKLWKTKKFIVAVLCFLALMGCSYVLSIQKGYAYHQQEANNLIKDYRIISGKAQSLKFKLQEYPTEDQEPKGMRDKYYLWKEADEACYDFINMRQAPEYFGWEAITKALGRYTTSLQRIQTSKYYEKELSLSSYTAEDINADVKFYNYMTKHRIDAYSSPYEPNFFNFIVQMFQNDSILLLIMIASFFIIDQICHDFDVGSYKTIYITPYRRSKIMAAKIISAVLMIVISMGIAFVIFSAVPIMTFGLGTPQYMYIFQHQMIGYVPYLAGVFAFLLLILCVYMTLCVLIATAFHNTTNAMLGMAGILIAIYLCVKFFTIHNPMVTWIPLFYLYPTEIMFGMYDYSMPICITISILSLVLMYMIFRKKMETSDLKGSDAS